jgi:hypothetical protein
MGDGSNLIVDVELARARARATVELGGPAAGVIPGG